jgi:hypothetical protein
MVLAKDFAYPQENIQLPAGQPIDRQMIDRLIALDTDDQHPIVVHVRHIGLPGTLRDARKVEAPRVLWKEVALRPAQLKPGMTLSRPLRHHEGYLLLAQGYYLDDMVIEQLRQLQAEDPEKPMAIHIRLEDRS